LRDYCRAQGLELWVFSVSSPEEYLALARVDEIDVVFCDDAPRVEQALSRRA
jgi:hypothetical protein